MKEASKPLETLQNDRSGLGYLPGEVPREMVNIWSSNWLKPISEVCCSPPIRPMHLINQIALESPHEWTRSDVQGPAMKTQVIESPKAPPITCNESLSKNGAPPLLETPNGAPSFSSCACGWCRTLLHWCRTELEWCGRVLNLWDQTWDKLGGIFHHRIVL